ncbi:MAG TPA: cysteine synthase A [Tenuifilaceae bacterium]|nr:cysteine synthase A [Tenuifilaceae bacterium]HRX32368.1 cysteine synthase A [Tenuifilaceae bacterium]
MKVKNVLDSIGGTPHVRLSRLFPENEVWIKDERRNPAGSIKDRAAYAMIEDAEKRGVLQKNGVIVEPTSGNTGIGLAMIAAVKGYRIILTMPESMSIERRRLLSAYGAELVLTPTSEGMKGAIAKAEEIVAKIPNAWMPMQFSNEANPNAHYRTTANEIIEDFPDGVDYLIVGVGTGGHISGVGKRLKEVFPAIKVIAVEPVTSPVISKGIAGSHPIQGIGAGFIPKNLNRQVVDDIITIDGDKAYEYVRKLARVEGLLAGISTGANLAATEAYLPEIGRNKRALTFAYDSGDRYLSVEGLF